MIALAEIRRLASSWRARTALLTNVLSSIGNLVLAIAIARSSSTNDLGKFAVAFSVYTLAVGLAQALVAESLLARRACRPQQHAGARRALLIGAVGGALLVAMALWGRSTFFFTLGLCLPGLVLYDYVKAMSLATGEARVALTQESVWTAVVLTFSGLTFTGYVTGIGVFIAWSLVGCVAGCASAHRIGFSLKPGWPQTEDNTSTSVSFGVDYLAGAGSAQLTTAILASVAGTVTVGALRAAGTLLGPITLLLGTARGLLIPYLARVRDAPPQARLRAALTATCLLITPIVPIAGGLIFLPDFLGYQIAGISWQFAAPLIPALALEVILAAVSAVAFAGHRIEAASRRTLIVRLCIAPARITAIAISGVVAGALGASIAMAATAAVGALVWWWSYTRILSEGRHA